jgi:flavodoxin
MSDLIVFYSFTGKARQDAEWLAFALRVDLAEIVEVNPRPYRSAFRCILDSFLRREPPIKPMARYAATYDRVILVAPVWAARLAGPVRTWLRTEGRHAKSLALVVQSGTGRYVKSVVDEIEAITGRKPAPVLSVTENDFGDHVAKSKINAFAKQLSPAVAHVA